jgi:hypothetical protein
LGWVQVQEAAAGFEINQDIDIAHRIGFPPDSRTEKADVAGAVPGSKAENIGALANYQVSLCHKSIVCGSLIMSIGNFSLIPEPAGIRSLLHALVRRSFL